MPKPDPCTCRAHDLERWKREHRGSGRGKPTVSVASTSPLVVVVSKNGRPVSEAAARGVLRKHFPDVSDWTFTENGGYGSYAPA